MESLIFLIIGIEILVITLYRQLFYHFGVNTNTMNNDLIKILTTIIITTTIIIMMIMISTTIFQNITEKLEKMK